jgi:quinoprotein glucose dehydrogenase
VLYVNGNNLPAISKIKAISKTREQTPAHHGMLSMAQKKLYMKGKQFYMANCASCHGADRQGSGHIPSLTHISNIMSKKQVIHQIKHGGGGMPAFANIISKAQIRQITTYLFTVRNMKFNREQEQTVDTIDGDLRWYKQYTDPPAHTDWKGPNGYPVIKPPWGTLSAINLNTGEYEWKIPFGTHSELKGKIDEPTGSRNSGGPIVTAGGLVFIGATSDNKFRAYDKDTGKLLWETTLNGRGRATPATYLVQGKQFVVITLSGKNGDKPQDTIVAFALPNK